MFLEKRASSLVEKMPNGILLIENDELSATGRNEAIGNMLRDG
jgi:hypothetical protein